MKSTLKQKHSALSDSESSDNSDHINKSWIDSFLEEKSNNWFCSIPYSYLSDEFNLVNIPVEHFKSAFSQLINRSNNSLDSSDSYDSDSEEIIDQCTTRMYGLIHARYIFTEEGTLAMYEKFQEGIFGQCPRFKCNGQHLLPIGMHDHPGISTAVLYCCKCQQLYHPDEIHSKIDGAFFSRSFVPFFLLELPKIQKNLKVESNSLPPNENSTPQNTNK